MGLLFLTVTFGAGAILHFEVDPAGRQEMSSADAFWFSLYSVFSGEPVPSRLRAWCVA